MRRLARFLFTLCSAISLVLCAALCVLWVRSYHWWDRGAMHWGTRSTTRVYLDSLHGALEVGCGRVRLVPMRPGFDAYWEPGDTADEDVMISALPSEYGVRWHRRDRYPPHAGLSIEVPHVVPILLSAVPALLAAGRWNRRRLLARHGLCPGCGYDLRASPERCPECGRAAAASAAAPPG